MTDQSKIRSKLRMKTKNCLSWSTYIGFGRKRYVFRVVLAGVASWEKMSRKRASQELKWWSEFTKKWSLHHAMQFCYFLEAKAGITRPRRVQGSRKGMTTSKVIIIAWSCYPAQKTMQAKVYKDNKSSFANAKSIQWMNFPHRPVVTFAPEMGLINPLRPSSVQNQFSPSDIHRLSRAKTTRIIKMISKRRIFDLLTNSVN